MITVGPLRVGEVHNERNVMILKHQQQTCGKFVRVFEAQSAGVMSNVYYKLFKNNCYYYSTSAHWIQGDR